MIAIMSPGFLDLLARLPGTDLCLPAGTLLFQRGDPVGHVYLVRSGLVHLLRRQEDGAAFLLQRAGPGALLAEASLLSQSYHCAAETIADSRLSRWPQHQVLGLVRQDPEAAFAFAAHLAGEVRAARLRAEIASLRRVADRLDAWLAWNGGALPDKGQRHLLARELNVTPEALYREIARRKARAA